MMKSRGRTRVGLAAVVILLAAGLTTQASHTGFEISFTLYNSTLNSGTSSCSTCRNWISLPVENKFVGSPVKRLSDVCADNSRFLEVGQPIRCFGTGTGTFQDRRYLDELCVHSCDGNPDQQVNPLYEQSRPLLVKLRFSPPGDGEYTVIGRHPQGRAVELYSSSVNGGTGSCQVCANWVILPYHSTAKRLLDICRENPKFLSVGQPGAASGNGDAASIDPSSVDNLAILNCETYNAKRDPNPPVTPGRPVRIVLKSSVDGLAVGDFFWRPQHY